MATSALKISLGMLLVALVFTNISSQSIDTLIAGASTNKDTFDTVDDLNSNQLLTELDMMMSKKEYEELYGIGSQRKKRKAIRSSRSRWPESTIPYTIASGVFNSAHEAQIQEAIKEWEQYTCIKFQRTSSRNADRILFDNGSGCYSYVGKVGGTQTVGLANGCRYKGIIVHEIGHAVGFHHEQNRPDRDEYVNIVKNNIPSRVYYNFKKYSTSAVNTYGVPYDYKSVMHYGGTAFSMNGRLTIQTKDSRMQNIIGNRKGLSFRDIKLANLMYPCNNGCDQKRCAGEGFVGKDCECWCPGNPVVKCGSTGTVNPVTPKPTTPKPTTKPQCKDVNTNCESWEKGGYCRTNTFVKTYCKKSCGTCDGGCVDMKSSCKAWAEAGYCTGTYEVYMTNKCAVSCDTCDMINQSEADLQGELEEKNDAITQGFSLLMVTIVTTLVGSIDI